MTQPKIFLFSLLVISAAVSVAFAAAKMYLRVTQTNVRSGIPQLFRDHIHPTVAGARRIAEVVTQALAQSTPFQREPTSGRSE
jgi:lysophospholipase L1-like esterase